MPEYTLICGEVAMKVSDLVDTFGLKVVAGETGIEKDVLGGHCGDLLSEVMGNATIGCVWVTVQGHQNIVAVAVLREMSAVIISGGGKPDVETIDKADKEGIALLTYEGSAFELSGRLYAEGLK